MKEDYIFYLSPGKGFIFMEKIEISRLVITLLFLLGAIFMFIKSFFKKKDMFNTVFMTRTAIFSCIATILYIVPYLKFPIPFFPGFLELHFDEVPALIGGFAYGPLCGAFIIIIKTIIKLPFSSTLCVGELADLIYGLVLVIPSALIYKRKRNIKGALIGLLVSCLIQVAVSSFLTTFVMLDFYMNVMGLSEKVILSMCQAVNPNVKSLDFNFLLWVAMPFNLFKDIVLFALTILLYKRTRKIIDKIKA